MTASASLTALLQLASPTLPVGAYSYSQGLESAIDAGLVYDEASALRWISEGLRLVLARYEAPLWLRLHRALANGELETAGIWNEEFLATRETAELRAETLQMGHSLALLIRSLDTDQAAPVGRPEGRPTGLSGLGRTDIAYPTAHAWACLAWGIGEDEGLTAYLYGWAENQVMAALKTVPLGQTAGQRLLLALRPVIIETARIASGLDDDSLSTSTPMLAILSSRHETQYSRLFRS